MAKTPTKLQILQKINQIIESHNSLQDKFIELLQKMDLDTGISDNDYIDLANIEPFSDEELQALDQLINLRE